MTIQAKKSVQLFTFMAEMAQDAAGTLEKVKELGFDGVELAGYGNLDADTFRRKVEELGLEVSSAHVPLDQWRNDADTVLKELKAMNCSYVAIPYLDDEEQHETGYQNLITLMKELAPKVKAYGMTLCYHHHDFELQHTMADGRSALKAILEDTAEAGVLPEFDVYWLKKAGENPLDWVKAYKDQLKVIHMKDMTTDGKAFFAELGTGGVDVKGLLDELQSSSLDWLIVEQDQTTKTPYESMKESMTFLNRYEEATT